MSRYSRLAAAAVLYLCAGCFWIRYDFVSDGLWSLGVIMVGIGAVVGGLLQERFAPSHVGYAGAALFGAGFAGAGLAASPVWHRFTLEVLIGGGSGIVYSTGIPLVARWLPDRVGLAIGAAVAGYVPASFVGGGLARGLIELIGWRTAAQVTGATLCVLLVVAIRALGPAPNPETPLWVSPVERTPGSMIRTRLFPLLWCSYALASTGAVMIYVVLPDHWSALSVSDGAGAIALSGLIAPVGQAANAAARVIAGGLSDVVGRLKVLWVAVGLIPIAGFVALVARRPEVLLAVAFLAFAGYGALLAIYPVVTAAEYGLRHVGANYGIVFSAWAVGYVAGVSLGFQVRGAFGGDGDAVVFVAATLIASLALLLTAKVPRPAPQAK